MKLFAARKTNRKGGIFAVIELYEEGSLLPNFTYCSLGDALLGITYEERCHGWSSTRVPISSEDADVFIPDWAGALSYVEDCRVNGCDVDDYVYRVQAYDRKIILGKKQSILTDNRGKIFAHSFHRTTTDKSRNLPLKSFRRNPTQTVDLVKIEDGVQKIFLRSGEYIAHSLTTKFIDVETVTLDTDRKTIIGATPINVGSRSEQFSPIGCVCAIRLKNCKKWKVEFHRDMFQMLRTTICYPQNNTFRNDLSLNGLGGCVIYFSEEIHFQENFLKTREEWVRIANKKGGSYNYVDADTTLVPVTKYTNVSGFRWSADNGKSWGRVETDNIISDMEKIYVKNIESGKCLIFKLF